MFIKVNISYPSLSWRIQIGDIICIYIQGKQGEWLLKFQLAALNLYKLSYELEYMLHKKFCLKL